MLQDNQALFRSMFERASAGMAIADREGRFTHCNLAFCSMLGYRHDEIVGRFFGDVLEPGDISLVEPELVGLVDEISSSSEWRFRRKDGSGFVGEALSCTLPDGLIQMTILDITERKRAQETLRENEERLRFALDAANAGFWESVPETGEFMASDRALALHGEPPGTPLSRQKAVDAVHPEDRPRVEENFRRAVSGREPFRHEFRFLLPDGEIRWVESRGESRTVSGRQVISGLLLDITHQKLAEQKLRESEARLSSIIDTAADSIIVSDEKGTIKLANPATVGVFGYSLEDLIGHNLRVLMPSNVRTRHDEYLDSFSGRSALKEVQGQRKSGEIVPLERTITEWRDEQGRRFFTGIFRDVTERKRNEQALAGARRLEAVGQLAGGVAHDFNNLLHVISGNLDIAQRLIDNETARGRIERARGAAEKGSALSQRLLSLAHKRALRPERLNLNDRVQDTAPLLASSVGEHIAVTTQLAANLWPTRSDPGEIDSAILNLAANARDAMPSGGNIRISTSNVSLDEFEAAKLHVHAKPGDYVCLAVADDGPGMSAEVLAKAFEPFFTTKGPGAGTGLGLASIANFAERTGGFASIESAPGKGCTVRVHLPRAIMESSARPVPPSAIQRGGGELVLVVEDDDMVREMTIKRLESLGYAVIDAKTGSEAIERLKSQEPIRLILSDIVMPGGVTGYDVMRWAAANKPGVKAILCSGYSDGDWVAVTQGALDSVNVLGKPYTREQLASAVKHGLR